VVNWIEFGSGIVVGLFVICFLIMAILLAWLFRERQTFAAQLTQARLNALSKSGVDARQAYRERRQAAIMEAVGLLQDAKGKDLKELLLPVAAKYPDVAVQLMKNPQVLLDDIRKMGLTLPPEVMQQINENMQKGQ